MSAVLVDIVLPCYNPQSGWEKIVIDNYNSLKLYFPNSINKLIIVNDGSQIINTNAVEYLQNSLAGELIFYSYSNNMGKGYALREAVKLSEADVIVYTDIDFPYTNESMHNVISLLLSNSTDIVVGVRNEEYYGHISTQRKVISKLVKWMLRTFLRLKVTDTQCGLKGFLKSSKALFTSTTINRYLFDMEFIYLASKNNSVRIKSETVMLRDGVTLGKLNWKILRTEMFNFLKILFN